MGNIQISDSRRNCDDSRLRDFLCVLPLVITPRPYRAWAFGSRNASRREVFARNNAFRSDGVFRRSVEMVDKQSSDDVYRTRMELRRKKITDIQIIYKRYNGGG